MTSKLRAAFAAVSQGFSPDRIIADPELNMLFLQKCVELGLAGDPATLNRSLINLRKRGELRGINSNPTRFPEQEEYRFAVEMAARFMERRDGISLDDILCDPQLAREFDKLAMKLAPGYSSLQYRWAAFNLRKASKLKPELLSRVVQSERITIHAIAELDVASISNNQGLYLFATSNQALYAGAAQNLRNRLIKHLEHSDNKGLAQWMWSQGSNVLFLEIHELPKDTETRVRKALEVEFIRSRKPTFNIQR
jgi:site-specific DNA-methyltransferase (adenine-specific)